MMDYKRFLELAVDGARANWLEAVDALRRNPTSENIRNREIKEAELRQVNKLQQSYENLMTDLSHSTLDEAFDEIESIRNGVSASEFVPEYIVRIKTDGDMREFHYATSEEARAKFNQKKRIAEVIPEYYHVQVFSHIRKGQMLLIAEAGGRNAADTVENRAGYKILITHNNGDFQTLRFDDIRAAKPTFELMKYELKANRIIKARLIRCVNGAIQQQLDCADRMTVAKEA